MTTPLRALEALLASTIDFAGMFPPAKLSFDETMRIAALWRRQALFPWLLGRIVLPVSNLSQVDDELVLSHGADGSPWFFTVLASDGPMAQELGEIAAFNRSQTEACVRKRVVGFEKKIETSAIESSWFRNTDLPLRDLLPLTIYFESSPSDHFSRVASQLRQLQDSSPFYFGIKLRTGGGTTPSAQTVASAIEAAVSHGIRFKVTQGLHEAISHNELFGFINLFVALNLKQGLGLDKTSIIDCLTDSDRSAFTVSEKGLRWKKQTVTLSELYQTRKTHAAAFGSCSLDEPESSLKQFLGV